jgi:hypothetical protein
MKHFFLLVISWPLLLACSKSLPPFKASDQPPAPDYSNENHWSALPFREDAPDVVPGGEKWVNDSLKSADVFYIYPTMYQKGDKWCADVNDKRLNKRIDKLPVRLQASAFNHVGRVYVPRYRQGIYLCFEDTTANGKAALDFAYQDVKRAFEYYLDHYNAGRPIIIASHSQGTHHARRLIKEFFDTPGTKEKLVCAYIVGFGVYPDQYEVLEPCADAAQVNCYVTWSTFKEGYTYKGPLEYYGEVCVNPVSWRMDTLSATGNGGILLNPGRKKPFATTARVVDGKFLWAKTNLILARRWDNMHLVDFNLFWHDIRQNAALRVGKYMESQAGNP